MKTFLSSFLVGAKMALMFIMILLVIDAMILVGTALQVASGTDTAHIGWIDYQLHAIYNFLK